MLKPQDIVILLKILSLSISEKHQGEVWSQSKLALHLCMSASEVNEGIKRLNVSQLLAPKIEYQHRYQLIKENCKECLISGVKYFIPAQIEMYTRGIATSYAAPIFEKYILKGNDPIPVWPHAEGKHLGFAFVPLYRSIPQSVIQYPDPYFYDLLALVDAIRSGRARERDIAIKLLKQMINHE